MNPRVFLLAVLVVALAGAAIFLATRDIPAPDHTITKAIPHDRFFK